MAGGGWSVLFQCIIYFIAVGRSRIVTNYVLTRYESNQKYVNQLLKVAWPFLFPVKQKIAVQVRGFYLCNGYLVASQFHQPTCCWKFSSEAGNLSTLIPRFVDLIYWLFIISQNFGNEKGASKENVSNWTHWQSWDAGASKDLSWSDQSCKMSQIWQIYLCKNIKKLG